MQGCTAAKRSFLEAEEEAAKAQKLADAASKDASGRSEDVEAQRAAMQQSQKAAEALAKALSARKLVCSTESLSPEKVCLCELLLFVVMGGLKGWPVSPFWSGEWDDAFVC